MKKMQVLTGLALSALVALSVIASTGPAFFATRTGGDEGLMVRGKTQGVTWEGAPVARGRTQGVTWEAAGVTWE